MIKFISDLILQKLGHVPTKGQMEMIDQLALFVSSPEADSIFLLKGYAGTGKTATISALVKVLDELKIKFVLLAPTGRAAKVLSKQSGMPASTIHKKIYRQQSAVDGFSKFSLDRNMLKNSIFIVDEASMISNGPRDQSVFGSGYLLSDLIEYVLGGLNCKLIVSGDTAQLPPVGLSISPALEKEELSLFGLKIITKELREVVRQSEESGILKNATSIRNRILEESPSGFWPIEMKGFSDMKRLGGEELIEEISNCFDSFGMEDTIVITRSNKRANLFNEGIRKSILYQEDQIMKGDLLMVVKNSYHWSKLMENLDFIANGDIAEILRIRKYEERYGFHFANVVLRLIDYQDSEIECKILLETLKVEAPALSADDNKRLFDAVSEDYQEIRNKRDRWKKIREDPYFNALQVKYSYAVTCHKAQGGQWKAVFLDHGYLLKEMIDREFLRWLYTAFTRAEERLYLVNFHKEFFSDPEN
ncbi:MAG TPA: AAA family ATPase [Prolixibacteraceae bacterium]